MRLNFTLIDEEGKTIAEGSAACLKVEWEKNSAQQGGSVYCQAALIGDRIRAALATILQEKEIPRVET